MYCDELLYIYYFIFVSSGHVVSTKFHMAHRCSQEEKNDWVTMVTARHLTLAHPCWIFHGNCLQRKMMAGWARWQFSIDRLCNMERQRSFYMRVKWGSTHGIVQSIWSIDFFYLLFFLRDQCNLCSSFDLYSAYLHCKYIRKWSY